MTPDEFTNQELRLDTGNGHSLYVQDWGNKQATMPIIFLHGGPGSGCSDGQKQYFDPARQRVIFFDQRGSGLSTPKGSLEHNTTDKLIEDISRVADRIGFDDFVLVGGSWGACLALAYALRYPKRVRAMVLRGIFTGSQAEIDFLDKGGFRHFFPDVWQTLLDRTPKAHHKDPAAYHQKRMFGSDPAAAKESAFAISELEGSLVRLDDRHTVQNIEDFDPSGITVEIHYTANRCFMKDNYILDNAAKLHMPVWLVQGRYDMVCPPLTAHTLHERLPNSQLVWTTAGHSGSDRANYDVVRSILLSMADKADA